MHNIKCPHSSTKMNPKSVGSRIEQSEMGNVKHVEIIPGPKRQAPPLPSSKRLFHLSLSLEWTSLKLKSSLCWFTLLFHIFSQFSPKPLNPIKRKTSSSPPQLLYNTIPSSNGFNTFLSPVLPRLLTPLCPAISFFPSSCLAPQATTLPPTQATPLLHNGLQNIPLARITFWLLLRKGYC